MTTQHVALEVQPAGTLGVDLTTKPVAALSVIRYVKPAIVPLPVAVIS
ncbi:MAG: hypothetical protein ABIW48_09595 [Burkholderiales bacterium]